MNQTYSVEAAWDSLEQLRDQESHLSIQDLFRDDPERAEAFSCEAAGLYLDYSKNRLSRATLTALLQLARGAGLEERRDAMLSGELINITEQRAVLHTALRDRSGRSVMVGGEDACALATAERERMLAFVDEIHRGQRRGATGQPLDTVVNIGIGGSDLGPVMVVEALRPYAIAGRRCHFVSNVDGQHLSDTLQDLDPERTLFIIASKTFTTQETMTNAHSALAWFRASGMDEKAVAKHFVALSTNHDAVAEFGIAADSTFGFWDWVGGRYSLWSSIGLSIALQVGAGRFLELLDGAHAMDEHFRTAPLASNMPVLLALVGIWNRNLEGHRCHAVLPYDQHLLRLPAHLQQADMESNGKSVDLQANATAQATGPVVFGEPGTNGQHAFYQLLHQGSDIVPTDFIAPAISQAELGDHHPKLLANFLAQPRALMNGRSLTEVEQEMRAGGADEETIALQAPHRVFPGNRPSNSLLMERLTPATLGALIALYEHRIFCQGVIWNINSFDQWGVELGKALARDILPYLPAVGAQATAAGADALDPSTAHLLAWINERRQRA